MTPMMNEDDLWPVDPVRAVVIGYDWDDNPVYANDNYCDLCNGPCDQTMKIEGDCE